MLSTNPLPHDHLFIDFCDRDSNWGPLLFLRPDRTRPLTALRIVAGAIILGIPLGLFGTIVMTLFARLVAQPAPALMYFPLILTVGYWCVAQATLARAWNRRAARLSRWG